MTPNQIHLVQHSFKAVVPIRAAAAADFYQRLFRLDPSLRPLFAHTDEREQGAKLMASLGFVVENLSRPDTVLPALRTLGRRHGGYGAQPEHFATVGKALLETLAAGLGPVFTPEVRQAWELAYAMVAEVMIESLAAEMAEV